MRTCLVLAVLLCVRVVSAGNGIQDTSIRKTVLSVWEERIRANGGVHRWNNKNDGLRVFQEWITLLELNRTAPVRKKRELGRQLEDYVVSQNMQALGSVGTSVPLPGLDNADFDMALLGCISLLGLFRDDSLLLTDRTYAHLIKNVVRCWGQEPKYYFDVLMLSFKETENHVFMIETTRYLTNQFIWENTRGLNELSSLRDSLEARGIVLDNERGIIYQMLLKQMHQVLKAGFFELNARIYQRYTLHALNNLFSFSKDSLVVTASQCVLDYAALKFAFQSTGSVRLGPYRRNAEKFRETSVLESDYTSSFFAVQTGSLPLTGRSMRALWARNAAHSSAALFSLVLKYRVPDLILDFARLRRGLYYAKMKTRHSVNRQPETTPEVTLTGPGFMLSAGGRYKFYKGANFPVPSEDFLLTGSPWVYDITSRSSSLLLYPFQNGDVDRDRDILVFRGLQWKENNLSVYKTFMYGYVEEDHSGSSGWPHQVPAAWETVPDMRFQSEFFEYRVIDLSAARGVYIVLTRLIPRKTWFKHDYQKYQRGTAEVISASRTEGLGQLTEKLKVLSAEDNGRYVYPLFNGERIHLDPQYSGTRDGILTIETSMHAQKGGRDEEVRPIRILPVTREDIPLLKVELLDSINLMPLMDLVETDERGNVSVYNPFLGDTLSLLFEFWWYPRRTEKHRRPDSSLYHN